MKINLTTVSTILLFISAFLPGKAAYSQAQHTSYWYDSTTYNSYLKQDWNSVIRSGNEALRNGYDYYYLRMRLAAANYEKGKFRNAISQYNKATTYNSGDESIPVNKYYSYLNLGDRDGAAFIAGRFTAAKRKEMSLSASKPLDFIYLESGISPSSGQGIQSGQLAGTDSIYGEEDLYKSMQYILLGGKVRISPSLAIFAGFTRMNIDKEKRFDYYTIHGQRDSVRTGPLRTDYFYSFPSRLISKVIAYEVSQNDIYLNAGYVVSEGFKIVPAVHFIQVHSRNILPVFGSKQMTDTAYFLAADTSWHMFNYTSDFYSFSERDTSYSNYVLSLAVTREVGNFSFDLHGSYSNFNSGKQKQAGVSVTWYPLGNTDIYTVTSLNGMFGPGQPGPVFEQMVGARLSRNIWLDGFVTSGKLDLYNEKNAWVVYNQSDPITFRWGANAIITAGKHLEVYLVYRYYTKELHYLQDQKIQPATGDPVIKSVNTAIPYTNQSFTGGLKWKF